MVNSISYRYITSVKESLAPKLMEISYISTKWLGLLISCTLLLS